MKQSTSKMQSLAAPDAYPLLLLEGRLSYRKAWAMREPKKTRPFDDADRRWELDYDDMHNFARMGAEFVDDEWGKPIPAKMPARKTSNSVIRMMQLMRGQR